MLESSKLSSQLLTAMGFQSAHKKSPYQPGIFVCDKNVEPQYFPAVAIDGSMNK